MDIIGFAMHNCGLRLFKVVWESEVWRAGLLMASFIFKFLVFNELYDRVTLMIIMFVPKVSKISCKHQPTKEAFDITAGCLSTRANSPMTGAPITTRVPRQKVAAGMGQDLSTSLLRHMFRI